MPIINYDASYAQYQNLRTDSDLLNKAKSEIDRVDRDSLKLTIDNQKLDSSNICRVLAICEVNFAQDDIYDDVKPGSSRLASDGYWVFLKALTDGSHLLHFEASGSGSHCVNDVSYDVKVG